MKSPGTFLETLPPPPSGADLRVTDCLGLFSLLHFEISVWIAKCTLSHYLAMRPVRLQTIVVTDIICDTTFGYMSDGAFQRGILELVEAFQVTFQVTSTYTKTGFRLCRPS
ncbi:unnamed protein product [Calypogeia fissa]